MIAKRGRQTPEPGLAGGLVLICLTLMAAGCRPPEKSTTGGPARRIVSMSPSITEILFALDYGARLVGATTYCLYPGAAAQLPRVGGYYDVNYEQILSLRPDLVLLPVEHVEAERRLRALGLACRMIDTATIPAIFTAIDQIGELCGAEAAAAALTEKMRRRMEQIAASTRGRPPRRVLISIGRNMGSGGLSDVYLAGGDTLYDEMLIMLGASNVFQGKLPYAQISQEAILRMNPDVIIDLAPELERSASLTRAQLIEDWQGLMSVSAVQHERIHVLEQDYVCIPGPRVPNLLEDIARAVYPEAFTEPVAGESAP